ncbi:DUF5677 domain-containing protein [Pseudomonas chengduensis]|jgi:hypothetical protein|uniref:Uncharacterized protein n=1 Tax=Ectopseudomonas chengduensis TaxID=489632 RepID=A0A1G6LPC0_9GAMM|nr:MULTISPECIES: DUF5677 domain-containing protein [Pseudomonas]KQO40870.1 hypothetical protein ASF15_21350 [Pseudomonas sp. Leaf83]MBP3060670.1 hypothetical protein [Pseudomonas chengduensis]MDH0957313.1 DUF5677 domain-containing protein [Pseudomonas chengduensis]MDH1535745.1 DUF5677 domain-containing protein [Pseudomonas chengduensis]NNB73738.1 hypothetical protein [Pseudomonas chengduensis]
MHTENATCPNPALVELLQEQLELLRVALFVATQGPAEMAGTQLHCSLEPSVVSASQPIAMCAGQSVSTILRCLDWRGIPVRDLYPIARSAVESFINAAFLVSQDNATSERALRYVKFGYWKQHNRNVGEGLFSLKLSSSGLPAGSTPAEFEEFTGKGQDTWTKLSLPSRINRVGQAAGRKAGSRLLAAYALIYSVSSEVIHGSPFGVSYFYSARAPASVEEFQKATVHQVEDILVAVAHAAAGYLSTFFTYQSMEVAVAAEQDIFNKLMAIEGVDPQ